jgi:predicted NUDIX family NTP pyrophosphohydrolase
MQEFPEVDKGDWFNMSDVKQKIHPVQVPFFERLVDAI